MKRKAMFVVVILAIGMMSVSCFKKKKDTKNDTQTQQEQKTINTDIFNLGGQAQGNPNIQNLTTEEQQNLIDNHKKLKYYAPKVSKPSKGGSKRIAKVRSFFMPKSRQCREGEE